MKVLFGKTLSDDRLPVKNCTGCGACFAACDKKAIAIRVSGDGFYRPQVGENCVRCGKCRSVCPALTVPRTSKLCDIFAAQAKDDFMLEKASSGGVSPVLARLFSAQGYKLCGVRYDARQGRAEHFIAASFDEFTDAYGSKYLQSYTAEAFRKVISDGGKYFVVGTPCQIAGLRKAAELCRRGGDIFFVDFWCHGVPSLKLWRTFLLAQHLDNGFVTARWRDKERHGWYNGYCVVLESEKRCIYSKAYLKGELYTRHFIRSSCVNMPCMNCPFDAEHSAADIRIGDFWSERFATSRGVSKVAVLTERGKEAWQRAEREIATLPISDQEREDVRMLNCGNRFAPRGVERSVFIWCLSRWNGFRLAHVWHLAWVACRRLKGVFKCER